ncbi:unnamed protein product [Lepeophtheirus salmonis]|uniref:(salmon louse) hypothetical protein n=1 Tax=Lepeophtheirus salmonis TaxID=72036 RepID=A0A7R8H121_LEPSM|nr:unnamed protein product [Lepeophtheirus salmonis]CAF2799648.1 unnamed protein product [Lepeophtheirus salmonis]
MATSSSNLHPEDSESGNSASGIHYSLKIMEEPVRNFEFQTGIDLASIVNSEIFDKVPPPMNSSGGLIRRPPSPSPKVRAPKRSSAFVTFQRRSLPPSYLQEALNSLFQKSSADYNSYISSKKKTYFTRLPLNLYEKFRHKSHVRMSSINESSSGQTESTSSSFSSFSSSSLTSISPTETEGTEVDVEAVDRSGSSNDEEKEYSSNVSENLQIVKKNKWSTPPCKGLAAANTELDQFYNESKCKYDCAFCKSIFKYKGTLKRHLLVKHTSGDGVIDFSKGGKSKTIVKPPLSRRQLI